MTALLCARCETEIRPEDARTDPEGRTYHRMCYDIAYPEQVRRDAGVTVTGVDIPFFDLMRLLFKITLAGIPVGFVFGLLWYSCSLMR